MYALSTRHGYGSDVYWNRRHLIDRYHDCILNHHISIYSHSITREWEFEVHSKNAGSTYLGKARLGWWRSSRCRQGVCQGLMRTGVPGAAARLACTSSAGGAWTYDLHPPCAPSPPDNNRAPVPCHPYPRIQSDSYISAVRMSQNYDLRSLWLSSFV